MIYKAELSIAEKATEYEERRIEASIHEDHIYGPILLLNVVKYEEGNPTTTSTTENTFPPISVSDIIRLLHAYGPVAVSGHETKPAYPNPITVATDG